MAHRSISDELVADEAVTYIIKCLSEDNWRRCEDYSGRASPETYLYSICSRLLVDYTRSKFGRKRPPEWLKKKGSTWLTLWEELCLNRESEQTVVEKHCRQQQKDEIAIHTIIRTIKAKIPWCGVSSRPESLDDNEDHSLPDSATCHDQDPDTEEQAQQSILFAHFLLNGLDEDVPALDEAQVQRMKSAVAAFSISPEELKILRMYFCDGLSGNAIAQHLGIAKHQPARLIKKILERAKQHFPTGN